MTRKQFNIVVNECRSTKCYHCGCKESCNKLNKVIPTPYTKYWRELTSEIQDIIKEV